MVLGTSWALFLPEDHPLIQTVDQAFGSFGIQGPVTAASDGPSLYRLKLSVSLDTVEEDTLVSSLMSARADSPILEGVVSPVVLPSDL